MINKTYISEFIGTYSLVFFGTGAIIVNDLVPETLGNLGIAIIFGAVVSVMIYCFGHISGAHINPAVTFGFWVAGSMKGKDLFWYFVAQFSGGLFASSLLYLLFPKHSMLGATMPQNGIWQAFILEIILSYILMLVIFQASSSSDIFKPFAGIIIGLTVMLEAAFAGPITGASMNPARSAGPAIISGNTQYLLHYMLASFIGMGLSILTIKQFKLIKQE